MTHVTADETGFVPDQVFVQLFEQILIGAIAPGHSLPSDREIADTHSVNRHAARDALERLARAGLVQLGHGGTGRVLDWRRNSGLDLLAELAGTGAVPASTLLRDVAEMRRSVGADAARLCAERANETQLARVLAMAHGYPDRPVGVAELTAADISFWDAVVDGSGNIAYRLALNTLRQGFLAIGVEHLVGLLEEYSDRDAHIALAAIIARRDGAAAHDRATALLGTFTSAVATADGAP